MDKKTKKRIMALYIASMCLFGAYKYEHKYTPNIAIICEDEDCFKARYSNGYVYIGTKEYLNSVQTTPNDVCVLVLTNGDDPDMKVISSYEIKDKDIRNEILEIICLYERLHPSDWDRTIESMRLEWFVHNFCYDCNHKIDHTRDVDFDNDEQELYDKYKILNKILKL